MNDGRNVSMLGPWMLGAILLGCSVDDRVGGGMFGDGAGTGGVDDDGGGGDSGGTDDGAGEGSGDDGSGGGDDGGAKFDVGSDGTGGGDGCQSADGECGCSFVDLLFVIDNSGSMGDYQNALTVAFPQFVDTLVGALPPATNVHVGVTSTEMQYSSMGSTSISNNVCTFTGDSGQPHTAFYVTPEQMDTGRNGAQGRLYMPNGAGAPFFGFSTDGAASELAAAKTWFEQAAKIGEGGSNIEMLVAPVGWVGDPSNNATNEDFIRDEGSVMVVFFMQDEPDQTPEMLDGKPGGTAMLERLATAKAGCGGTSCIVAGGFLNDNACGGRPIDDFLGGLPDQPAIARLPNENLAEDDPQAAADEMSLLLSDVLADVIATKCEEIPPVG